MSNQPELAPGTVSKILWHFSGGPTWNETEKRQNRAPKPAADAYANLKSILKTRQLRLGTYKEIVKVVIPARRTNQSRLDGGEVVIPEKEVTFESFPVCCLSDIPAAHLGYHAYRYGKFALGFHRDAAVRHGFNPVFYSLRTTGVVRSIYNGFSELEGVDPSLIQSAAQDIESAVDDVGEDVDLNVFSELSDIDWEADQIADTVQSARSAMREFVAFVKTFSNEEFGSIYCEREWRALKMFEFDYDDVAMIVVPKQVDRRKYFRDLIGRNGKDLKLPRSIPIVPWEDLVEH